MKHLFVIAFFYDGNYQLPEWKLRHCHVIIPTPSTLCEWNIVVLQEAKHSLSGFQSISFLIWLLQFAPCCLSNLYRFWLKCFPKLSNPMTLTYFNAISNLKTWIGQYNNRMCLEVLRKNILHWQAILRTTGGKIVHFVYRNNLFQNQFKNVDL